MIRGTRPILALAIPTDVPVIVVNDRSNDKR